MLSHELAVWSIVFVQMQKAAAPELWLLYELNTYWSFHWTIQHQLRRTLNQRSSWPGQIAVRNTMQYYQAYWCIPFNLYNHVYITILTECAKCPISPYTICISTALLLPLIIASLVAIIYVSRPSHVWLLVLHISLTRYIGLPMFLWPSIFHSCINCSCVWCTIYGRLGLAYMHIQIIWTYVC